MTDYQRFPPNSPLLEDQLHNHHHHFSHQYPQHDYIHSTMHSLQPIEMAPMHTRHVPTLMLDDDNPSHEINYPFCDHHHLASSSYQMDNGQMNEKRTIEEFQQVSINSEHQLFLSSIPRSKLFFSTHQTSLKSSYLTSHGHFDNTTSNISQNGCNDSRDHDNGMNSQSPDYEALNLNCFTHRPSSSHHMLNIANIPSHLDSMGEDVTTEDHSRRNGQVSNDNNFFQDPSTSIGETSLNHFLLDPLLLQCNENIGKLVIHSNMNDSTEDLLRLVRNMHMNEEAVSSNLSSSSNNENYDGSVRTEKLLKPMMNDGNIHSNHHVSPLMMMLTSPWPSYDEHNLSKQDKHFINPEYSSAIHPHTKHHQRPICDSLELQNTNIIEDQGNSNHHSKIRVHPNHQTIKPSHTDRFHSSQLITDPTTSNMGSETHPITKSSQNTLLNGIKNKVAATRHRSARYLSITTALPHILSKSKSTKMLSSPSKLTTAKTIVTTTTTTNGTEVLGKIAMESKIPSNANGTKKISRDKNGYNLGVQLTGHIQVVSTANASSSFSPSSILDANHPIPSNHRMNTINDNKLAPSPIHQIFSSHTNTTHEPIQKTNTTLPSSDLDSNLTMISHMPISNWTHTDSDHLYSVVGTSIRSTTSSPHLDSNEDHNINYFSKANNNINTYPPFSLSPSIRLRSSASILDYVGYLYPMCRDQYGCRFLQKKLNEDPSPFNCELILQEILVHMVELMSNPFGNYLCQKLIEKCMLSHRIQIVKHIAIDLVSISKSIHGTRAIQKTIEYLTTSDEVNIFRNAFRDQVVHLIQDPNGNHVVQKCILHLSQDDNQFIYDAVAKHCVQVSTHRHGCCVMQRCIDQASSSQRSQLIEEVQKNALELVVDQFGNYVIQYILDLGIESICETLASNLVKDLFYLSRQKFSSNVVEKCLKVGNAQTIELITKTLASPSPLNSHYHDKTSISATIPQHRHTNSLDLHDLKNQCNIDRTGSSRDERDQIKTSVQISNSIKDIPDSSTSHNMVQITQDPLISLLLHPYGNYVIQTALHESHQKAMDACEQLANYIRPYLPWLKNSLHIKRIQSLLPPYSSLFSGYQKGKEGNKRGEQGKRNNDNSLRSKTVQMTSQLENQPSHESSSNRSTSKIKNKSSNSSSSYGKEKNIYPKGTMPLRLLHHNKIQLQPSP